MKAPLPQIITLGCRLNAYESEVIRAHVAAAGLSDIVIVNSCAVTGMAERQTRQEIRKARRENPSALVVVTGCAAQINPDLYAAMPEVDAVLSNADKLRAEVYVELKKTKHKNTPVIASEAKQSRAKQNYLCYCDSGLLRFARNDGDFVDSPLIEGFEGLTRAFVQVQSGCDNECTFCIIPQGRGKSHSVAPSRIIEQIKKLAANYPEITLTGVDISSYSVDGLRLGGMVKKLLAEVPEMKRLRLSSLDPAALDDDLWDVIASEPRLMPHLHLSVQAGDDMILKRMKRRHLRKDIYDLVARARRLRPAIVFGADVIAGFPTEDDAMFDNTKRMFEELDFTWLHVFPYSARRDTPAAKMPQVKSEVRKARAAILRDVGEKAVVRHLNSLVGKRLALHVEGENLGRAPSFAEISLTSPHKVGSVIEAQIVGVEGDKAIGEIV